jgi:hypothetical protein
VNKLLTLTILAFCLTTPALAQTNEGFNRFEFYGGFSHNRVSTVPDTAPALFSTPDTAPADFFDRDGLNGFEATFTANVTKYVGVKGAVMGFYGTRTFTIPTFLCRPGQPCPNPCVVALTCPDRFNRDTSLHQFLGGAQFKDNSTMAAVKPFAHVLVGVARRNFNFYPTRTTPTRTAARPAASSALTGVASPPTSPEVLTCASAATLTCASFRSATTRRASAERRTTTSASASASPSTDALNLV